MALVTVSPKILHIVDKTRTGRTQNIKPSAQATVSQVHLQGHAAKPTLECSDQPNGKGVIRVLIIGATGYIGRFIAEASLSSRKTTYVLTRPGAASPGKAEAIRALQEAGAIILQGSMNDRDYMFSVLRDLKIDVVISAVGGVSTMKQMELVDIIKSAGSVKRFLPSEFGHDIDKTNPVEPGLTMYKEKRAIRRAVEAAGIPYTYICCNSIAAWPYYDQTHPSEVPPPLDRFQIYGDGNVKAYFVSGPDIGKFTMKTVDDPRTLNTTVHFRPPCNFLTVNELASLWENKIGKELPKVFLSETQLLDMAREEQLPRSIVAALTHDIFINGCQYKFSIDGEEEAGMLYPDLRYETVEECFDSFLSDVI